MLKIEKTSIIDRYNLVDTDKTGDEHYLRQISKKDLKSIVISGFMEL